MKPASGWKSYNRCRFYLAGFLSLSTVLHLFALLLLVFCIAKRPLLQPVLVDLSMEVSNLAAGRSAAAPAAGKSAQAAAAKAVPPSTRSATTAKADPPSTRSAAAVTTVPPSAKQAAQPKAVPPLSMSSIKESHLSSGQDGGELTKTVAAGEQVGGNLSGTSPKSATAGGVGGSNPGDKAGAAAEAEQRYLRENFDQLREKIMANLKYPPLARRMNWSGRTLISFRVNLDGQVSHLQVKEGSGHEILDRAALETVKKSAPFPKPAYPVQIILPVNFKLL